MTPEIRRAALRAAAKAALVVTVGCSGGGKSSPSPSPSNSSGTATAVETAPMACKDHLGALAKGSKDSVAADDPIREHSGVYGDVFTDRAARESARTQECCEEQLASDGAQAAQRWECCSALATPSETSRVACTPWGPPCPPAMA